MEGPGVLTYAAVALLIAVVGAVTAVLSLDSRRQSDGHWLDTLRQWQGLLGSVLGFISAAGVLVLGTSLQSYQAERKAAETSHAIGLGLALEVDQLANGFRDGVQEGGTLTFTGANLTGECRAFVSQLESILAPDTPVYAATVSNLVSFGDENLVMFVRFYALYGDFVRGLKEMPDLDCVGAPEQTLHFLLRQMGNGIGFADIVAHAYLQGISANAVPPATTAAATLPGDGGAQPAAPGGTAAGGSTTLAGGAVAASAQPGPMAEPPPLSGAGLAPGPGTTPGHDIPVSASTPAASATEPRWPG